MPEEILERPKFLVELLGEVDTFDATLFPPSYKLEEGDRVLAVVEDPWLRKCYSLMRHYHRQMKFLAVDREYHSAEDVMADTEVGEMKYKYDTLNQILWASVRARYNAYHAESIGLREDWQLVESQPDDDSDPFKAMFLAMMRGRKPKE